MSELSPDPWGHIRAGDLDPYPNRSQLCGAAFAPWRCTREPHPPRWRHIAGTGCRVLRVWPGTAPAAGPPECLHCGLRPASHVVFGDPLCDGCYDAHRAEGGVVTGPTYLTDVDAAGQEIGALAWWLSEVVRLDDEVDDLTAGAMREEIRRIAEQVRGRESLRRAGEVTR